MIDRIFIGAEDPNNKEHWEDEAIEVTRKNDCVCLKYKNALTGIIVDFEDLAKAFVALDH